MSGIAVVGYEVRFAAAECKEEYWEVLRSGTRTHFKPCPPARRHGDVGSTEAGWLDTAEQAGALLRTTTERALLEVKSSGEDLDLTRVGLITTELSFPYTSDYTVAEQVYQTPWSATGTFHTPVGPTLADELGLGPVRFALDAACASAIYALRLGELYLRRGAADMMLVGGVTLADPDFVLSGFEAMGALAPTGPATPLCGTSKGLTPGDGVAMYCLKRVEDAVRDGDTIHGVLCDMHLTNAGKGSPLRPSVEAEVRCLNVPSPTLSTHTVDYVECHATGTPIGDRCELDAVQQVFGLSVRNGSCKGNVGHTLVCAGFAGLAKILLAMERGAPPPATPGITTPLSPQTVTVANPGEPIQRAALNAFGFGGTNGHLRVSKEPPPLSPSPTNPWPKSSTITVCGMDAHIGSVRGLGAVADRMAQPNQTFFGPLPAHRWRGLHDRIAVPAQGAWCDTVTLDCKDWRTNPVDGDSLLPQHLLCVSVARNAILDAGAVLQDTTNAAVVVGLGTDHSLNRFHAVRRHVPATTFVDKSTSGATYAIGNVTATRIASLWDLKGPAFTVDDGRATWERCLQVATLLLESGSVEAVVVACVETADAERAWALGPHTAIGEGAVCMVLTSSWGGGESSEAHGDKRSTYAALGSDVWSRPTASEGTPQCGDVGRLTGAVHHLRAILAHTKRRVQHPPEAKSLRPLCLGQQTTQPLWNAKDLLEYAEGRIEPVFGTEYASIDRYKRRVRLPQRDYLLCTRVTKMEASLHCYEPSSMTTEYDLPINGPFSRGGDIPWAVLVEAGQCDLMLISYLGIDFQNQSDRVYRLLDTTLTFHGVAHEGETLRYQIHIDSFAKQGDKVLFFFHYDCYVGSRLLIEMRGGCAGFFTDEELQQGKGVVFTAAEVRQREAAAATTTSVRPVDKRQATHKQTLTPEDMIELCDRKWGSVLGPTCAELTAAFTTPKILMIDRITTIQPNGGMHGLGLLVGEKVLAPDHWYFPCHFKDDEVMAGSLVSDGCSQLLKVYMAWTGMHHKFEDHDVKFRPIYGLGNKVRCRGQIKPHNGKLVYVLEIKESGYDADGFPYVNADVNILDIDADQGQTYDHDQDWHRYGRGDPQHRIVVDFKNIGLHMEGPLRSGIRTCAAGPVPGTVAEASTRSELDWHPLAGVQGNPTPSFTPSSYPPRAIQFTPFPGNANDCNHTPGVLPLSWFNISEFAYGKLSQCFGDAFAQYDVGSTASRMPGFELQLVTRILSTQKPNDPGNAVMISEFDCPSDAWFYAANGDRMPYSILMEIGLQTSGFLSALTVALKMPHPDPMFRNLDADATLLSDPAVCRGKTICNRTTATSFSFLGNMMVHKFAFELSVDGSVFYRGTTSFGWFEPSVFVKQVGLDGGKATRPWHEERGVSTQTLCPKTRRGPLLRYVDQLVWNPSAGEHDQGYVHGVKRINPQDWFFSCHFWLDPVMPGSLGLEAMHELLEAYAVGRGFTGKIRHREGMTSWKYRGQLVPTNKQMDVAIHVTSVTLDLDAGTVCLEADGNLCVDGLRIYHVRNIGIVVGTHATSIHPTNTTNTTLPSRVDPRTTPESRFCAALGVRLPVFASSMAKGLSSPALVIAMARAGLLASYGAGGLPPAQVEADLQQITAALPNAEPWCVNLIHSPFDPTLELDNVACFLRHGVTIVEVSAFMNITPAIVWYLCAGLRSENGSVRRHNRILAKMSRTELARLFLSPAEPKLLDQLLSDGRITAEQRRLAADQPLCDFLTCEADSGGHTDNRAATVLFPTVLRLRDELAPHVPVGMSGGIGCPSAVRAARAMGADYVGIGTIAQPCRESGTCDAVRRMLFNASATDVGMAAAADMFSQGVKLQVLKKGTMFAQRANHLYELYRAYDSFDQMPPAVLRRIETKYFQATVAEVWESTVQRYRDGVKDMTKVDKAATDRKLHMDMCMRWYLSNSSRWANAGTHGRRLDYQVWCGPAIGSFNAWIKGTQLDPLVSGQFPSIVDVCTALLKYW